MKLFEKILLGITILIIILQVTGLLGGLFLLAPMIYILGIAYLFFGNWLLSSKEKFLRILSITSGFAIACALFPLPLLFREDAKQFFKILLIPGGIIDLVLLVYCFYKKSLIVVPKHIKFIFLRIFVILTIDSFFIFIPNTYIPKIKLLEFINTGNKNLINALYIVEYDNYFQNAYKTGDCDKAIEYAKKANEYGKLWLESDTNNTYVISKTFHDIYLGYKCKADEEYQSGRFINALSDYQNAYKFISEEVNSSISWKEEISNALNYIAKTYAQLRKVQQADSFFILARDNYKAIKGAHESKKAYLYTNFGHFLSQIGHYRNSSTYLQIADWIYRKDTLNEDNRSALLSNYIDLTNNFLQQDSLEDALFFVKRATAFSNKRNPNFIVVLSMYGIIYYKMNEFHKADSIFRSCLSYAEKDSSNNQLGIAACYVYLSECDIALGRFDEAMQYANLSGEIIKKFKGTNNSQYAEVMELLAQANKISGYYSSAVKYYNEAIAIYTFYDNKDHIALPFVWKDFSDLEVILSNFDLAKQYSQNSLATANNSSDSIALSSLWNQEAFVDYCLGNYAQAIKLYNRVIQINSDFLPDKNTHISTALNGLGLVEMAQGHFVNAGAFFGQSLGLCENIYTFDNPQFDKVLLNISNLFIKEGKLSYAKDNLDGIYSREKKFFKPDHDIFGDIYVAYGDIALKEGQKGLAKEDYQKALVIYENKFDKGHSKIEATKRKLAKI